MSNQSGTTCRVPVARAAAVLLGVLALASPARAQVDLSGMWARQSHEDTIHRGAGPELGDYTGIPVNAAGRLKAETWDASILSLPEEQAKPHAAQYSMRGPGPNFRMGTIVDPVTQQLTAYTINNLFGNADRTIWLDGRPHPSPYAEHTWSGFSTGVWERGALKVTTTHMKAGWLQRNGVTASAYSTMTEYFVRHGADRLLVMTVVEDPVYLDEPFVRTSNFIASPTLTIAVPPRFVILDEIAGRPKGYVPSYPMGTRHTEFAEHAGLPFEATRGGRHTVYPEYMPTIPRLRAGTNGSGAAGVAPVPDAGAGGATGLAGRDLTASAVLPVQGRIHMIATPTGNVTALVGEEGVLLVDTNVSSAVEHVADAVRRLSTRPIGFIINTSAGPRSTGSNDVLARMGVSPVNAAGNSGVRIEGAPVLAHENAMKRMSGPTGSQPAEPFAKWPSLTFFSEKFTTSFNGEPIEVLHQPRAHTDGDLIVFFRKSDVISTGSVFMTTSYPVIDLARGGSVQGTLDALNRIIDVAIPEFNQQRGTLIVPGQGRICNESDVAEYRDMVTIVRDRIQRMIDQGMSLAQVRAARPTLDYDALYGSTTGPWTTDMFIEAVHRDLTGRSGSPAR